jgi:hypothetical protein
MIKIPMQLHARDWQCAEKFMDVTTKFNAARLLKAYTLVFKKPESFQFELSEWWLFALMYAFKKMHGLSPIFYDDKEFEFTLEDPVAFQTKLENIKRNQVFKPEEDQRKLSNFMQSLNTGKSFEELDPEMKR